MNEIFGTAVYKGISIGKVLMYEAFHCDGIEEHFTDSSADKQSDRLMNALKTAEKELDAVIRSFGENESDKAKIFYAHKEILYDEDILEDICQIIRDRSYTAEYAVKKVFEKYIDIISSLNDPLIAERADDLKDVRNRVIRVLQGKTEKGLSQLEEPVIVVSRDLLPGDTATMDREKVMGIITEIGGTTSHSAILSRSFKIPAVLGVREATQKLTDGMNIILNAIEGKIVFGFDQDTLNDYKEKRRNFIKEREKTEKFVDKEALLKSGEKIEIGINIGNDDHTDGYHNSDFIGLFRTEFLYMEKDRMPAEDEQFESYQRVLKQADGKTVTLRTLDIGGDKTVKYIELPKEENPFLGKRAIRFCLDNEKLFRTQLRAAYRASVYGDLWIMFPMVNSIDDIRNAKRVVQDVKDELKAKNIDYREDVKIGVMIEIPSIALIADLVSREVDFASIGTNDLCQYTMAVDRMNSDIKEYYQEYSPAMMRLLKHIIYEFNKNGKPISVCGEMAGDPLAAVALVGMGIKKLSMSESNIAEVKQALTSVRLTEAVNLAEQIVTLETEKEIVDVLKKINQG